MDTTTKNKFLAANESRAAFAVALSFLNSQNLKKGFLPVINSGKKTTGETVWLEMAVISSPGFSILKTFDSPELFA